MFSLPLTPTITRSTCALQYVKISSHVAVPVCAILVSGCLGLWPFRFVAVPVCGHFSLWPFRFVAVSVCGRYDLLSL